MKTIKLTKGKVCLVDDEDFENLNQYKWHLCSGYAARSVGYKDNKHMLYMHRVILNITNSKIYVDHKDSNKLNNTKSNLRTCTQSQNGANARTPSMKKTSKYKGVYFDKSRKKWTARIKVKYIGKFLGRYDTELEAAKAYNKAAFEIFGEFARLNKV